MVRMNRFDLSSLHVIIQLKVSLVAPIVMYRDEKVTVERNMLAK